MVDLKPTALFPGWTYADGTISLPRTDLFELSAAACDPVTGDARAVALALLKTMFERYNEMSERPLAAKMRYEPGNFMVFGEFAERVRAQFFLTFQVRFPEETIADEPT